MGLYKGKKAPITNYKLTFTLLLLPNFSIQHQEKNVTTRTKNFSRESYGFTTSGMIVSTVFYKPPLLFPCYNYQLQVKFLMLSL